MIKIKLLSTMLMFLVTGRLFAQQVSSAELQVTGLTCSMCSQATEKSLKTLGFIEGIKPDLNKNIFVLDFKKDKAVNIDLIKKKVQDAGFSVGSLTAMFNFNNTRIDEKGQVIVGGNVYQFLNVKNKSLNGDIKVSIVDKDFISGASFRKNSSQFKIESYASGYGNIDGKKLRIYHLSI